MLGESQKEVAALAATIARAVAQRTQSGAALPVLRLDYLAGIGARIVQVCCVRTDGRSSVLERLVLEWRSRESLQESTLISSCIDAGIMNFLVDVSSFQWLNSASIELLISLQTLVVKRGGTAVFVVRHERAREILRATSLDQILTLVRSAEEGLARLIPE